MEKIYINTDQELRKSLNKVVEQHRVSYEVANQELAERFEDEEINEQELQDHIRDNYNQELDKLKASITSINISPDFQADSPALTLSSVFDVFDFEDDMQTLQSFVKDANAIDALQDHIFDDAKSVDDRIHETIKIVNDSIVMSDKIGRLIDNEITSKISGEATEELGWIKAYQIILSKMKPEDRDAELTEFQGLNSADFTKMLKQRINNYQQILGMHMPFKGPPEYSFDAAKTGEPDIFTKLPDGSFLIIAANKLVDNQMEGTQTVRHPMEVALEKVFGKKIKTPSTDTFDEFCRKIIKVKTFNTSELSKLEEFEKGFFKDILADKGRLEKIRQAYYAIHVHTFQTYNQPNYTDDELDSVIFFDDDNINRETKYAKLSQIQATFQFRANNINNQMVEDRNTKHTGKQKSDSAGTHVDKRSLTWGGVMSFIDNYIDNDLQNPDNRGDPIALVQTKMLRGSLPQRAAFTTVLIDRINQRSIQGSLLKDKSLKLLKYISESEMAKGITAKSKFFSIPLVGYIDRIVAENVAAKAQEGEAKANKQVADYAAREQKMIEKSIKGNDLEEDLAYDMFSLNGLEVYIRKAVSELEWNNPDPVADGYKVETFELQAIQTWLERQDPRTPQINELIDVIDVFKREVLGRQEQTPTITQDTITTQNGENI